jgi:hypothetical protein
MACASAKMFHAVVHRPLRLSMWPESCQRHQRPWYQRLMLSPPPQISSLLQKTRIAMCQVVVVPILIYYAGCGGNCQERGRVLLHISKGVCPHCRCQPGAEFLELCRHVHRIPICFGQVFGVQWCWLRLVLFAGPFLSYQFSRKPENPPEDHHATQDRQPL